MNDKYNEEVIKLRTMHNVDPIETEKKLKELNDSLNTKHNNNPIIFECDFDKYFIIGCLVIILIIGIISKSNVFLYLFGFAFF